MALACGFGLIGCGNKQAVSVDLDGDGVVSSWETLFESAKKDDCKINTSLLKGNYVRIKSVADLLAINTNYNSEITGYILDKDLDLEGEEVCINLRTARFYGNDHTISNFKLGKYHAEDFVETPDGESVVEAAPSGLMCLFYRGAEICDLNVFMGMQEINLNEGELGNSSCHQFRISPFLNTTKLYNVNVKGMLDVLSPNVDRDGSQVIYASLMNNTTEQLDPAVPENVYDSEIREVTVDGNIYVITDDKPLDKLIVGGVSSLLTEDSLICDAKSKVNIKFELDAVCGSTIAGAIVGENSGFVSTTNATGNINGVVKSQGNINIGGVAGLNNNCAEIKNSSNNMIINYIGESDNSDELSIGGVVGNNAGIIECSESDSILNITNSSKQVYAGNVSGYNNNGIISYAICRGQINVKSVDKISLAQISGYSNKGMIEKIVTTTGINVDNTEIASRVFVGMVTVFEHNVVHGNGFTDDEATSKNSPYFRKILVDGVTSVSMKKGDRFEYQLGLRNPFRKKTGSVEIEDGNGDIIQQDVYGVAIPEIFSNIYYVAKGTLSQTGCQLVKYDVEQGVSQDANIAIQYAKDQYGNTIILQGSTRSGWLIDGLDFKNFLNHNEVNLEGNVTFNDLHFTLNEKEREVSYFGEGQYNGELAYYNREFDRSYDHTHSSSDCQDISKDEYMSFMYDLISKKSNNAYAVKYNEGFVPDFNDPNVPYVPGVLWLAENTQKIFACLGMTINKGDRGSTFTNQITFLDDSNVQIFEDESDFVEKVRYMKLEFTNIEDSDSDGVDETYSYTFLFDVGEFKSDRSNIVFVKFSAVLVPVSN